MKPKTYLLLQLFLLSSLCKQQMGLAGGKSMRSARDPALLLHL